MGVLRTVLILQGGGGGGAAPHGAPGVCTKGLTWVTNVSEFSALRKHENTAHREKTTTWVAPYYGCSLSLGRAARISCALYWDKKII